MPTAGLLNQEQTRWNRQTWNFSISPGVTGGFSGDSVVDFVVSINPGLTGGFATDSQASLVGTVTAGVTGGFTPTAVLTIPVSISATGTTGFSAAGTLSILVALSPGVTAGASSAADAAVVGAVTAAATAGYTAGAGGAQLVAAITAAMTGGLTPVGQADFQSGISAAVAADLVERGDLPPSVSLDGESGAGMGSLQTLSPTMTALLNQFPFTEICDLVANGAVWSDAYRLAGAQAIVAFLNTGVGFGVLWFNRAQAQATLGRMVAERSASDPGFAYYIQQAQSM